MATPDFFGLFFVRLLGLAPRCLSFFLRLTYGYFTHFLTPLFLTRTLSHRSWVRGWAFFCYFVFHFVCCVLFLSVREARIGAGGTL
jgi:hypothetical protein